MKPECQDLLTTLVDRDTFHSWDTSPRQPETTTATYWEELAQASARSGVDESVVTGEGRINGHRVALVASEFAFLAGSIGTAAAQRILTAINRATTEGLPLVAAPASGGTRMHEGTPAFVQMAPIAAALRAHKDAGFLYAVYLRHPTTGGTMASWGSLGQITLAAPAALVGFLGPKVYRALHGADFPPGVQTSENLHRVGLVDDVATPEVLRDRVATVLDITSGRADVPSRRRHHEPGRQQPAPVARDAWDVVCATRRGDHPGLADLLEAAASDVVPLHGTGTGEHDPTVMVALARIGGVGCVVIGQDSSAQASDREIGPAGLRQAQRGLRLAAELRLPVVTVIDTPGAELSRSAEEGGLAQEIARCLESLGTHPSPSVAVLLGQGCGGAALALLPCDRVVALERSWLAPLPPEGASTIRHGVPDHAPDLARAQRITATELHACGVVHRVLPDAGGSAAWLDRLADSLTEELTSLTTSAAAAASVHDSRRAGQGRDSGVAQVKASL